MKNFDIRYEVTTVLNCYCFLCILKTNKQIKNIANVHYLKARGRHFLHCAIAVEAVGSLSPSAGHTDVVFQGFRVLYQVTDGMVRRPKTGH